MRRRRRNPAEMKPSLDAVHLGPFLALLGISAALIGFVVISSKPVK